MGVTYSRISPDNQALNSKLLELIYWEQPLHGRRIKSPGATAYSIAMAKFQFALHFIDAPKYYNLARYIWFPGRFGDPMFKDIESSTAEFPDQIFNQDALWMWHQGAIYVRDDRTMMQVKLKWTYGTLCEDPINAV